MEGSQGYWGSVGTPAPVRNFTKCRLTVREGLKKTSRESQNAALWNSLRLSICLSCGSVLVKAPRPPLPLQIRANFARNPGGGAPPLIGNVQKLLKGGPLLFFAHFWGGGGAPPLRECAKLAWLEKLYTTILYSTGGKVAVNTTVGLIAELFITSCTFISSYKQVFKKLTIN